jgi:HPt (histidine-containing phosphotransfer) domain-containing protein
VDESLPVLDPTPLLALADEAGDAVAQRFLVEYLNLLPARVSRVIGGLSSSDVESSRDAVVSLKVSSAMAGATRMEHYCLELEDRLTARTMPDAAAALLSMSRISRLLLQDIRGPGGNSERAGSGTIGGMGPDAAP